MNRVDLKNMAKAQIKGNIGVLFACTVVVVVICLVAELVLGFIPVIGPLTYTIVFGSAFELSLAIIYIGLVKGKKPEVGDVFSGFYDFWSAFKVIFFQGLFSCLWGLLFVIPGIIKMISYSMAMYILAENKGMSALEAISKSKEMMHGHKMDFFVLELSFIGWILLVAATFGVATIWVVPYMETTMVNFYNSVKGESNIIEIKPEI